MNTRSMAAVLTLTFTLMLTTSAHAVLIEWADWTSVPNGTTILGKITTPTSTVNVAYTNPQGVGFANITGGGTDYWTNNFGVRDASDSPYTSTFVDNIPTGTDIIALRHSGTQSLFFSETIANPVFSYVSLNGNGYAFDQDFEILSFGNAIDGNDCGYWGCGTSFKDVVEVNPGIFEYRLLGTGEPHGTLRFTGAFDTVSWRSLSDEYWNGFTVGVQGTAAEVFPDTRPSAVPEPASIALFATGMVGAVIRKKFRA